VISGVATAVLLDISYITMLACSELCKYDERLETLKTLRSNSFVAGDLDGVVADVGSGRAATVYVLLNGEARCL